MSFVKVGDLVFCPDGWPAAVTAVSPAEGDTPAVCDVQRPGRAVNSYYDHELTPVSHRPAPGQVWQCITRPDLMVEVVAVDDTGLRADCRVPSGKVTTIILPGFYELAVA